MLATIKAQAQDDHFEFHSPFGSDGTNQPGLSVDERNAEVYDRLWDFYVSARKEINAPFPKADPNGYDQAHINHWMTILRLGSLLETMAELRAFTTQHPGFAVGNEKSELAKMDRILRSLKLHYTSYLVVDPSTGRPANSGQLMVDFCDRVGVDKVAMSLRPLLYQKNGLPRRIPFGGPAELHTIVFD